ncbi:MAG: membrane protein insertion efficiency factor YidD [Treponema sp.]|nr:membrane protein insertion efficiency factor YidD [Treponema sp.]
MILAVKRHGAKAGIQKGIKRIIRCKVPNGGIDWKAGSIPRSLLRKIYNT